MLATGLEFVTPWEPFAVEAAPGGALPLGLGREPSAAPTAVRLGVVPADMDNRVIEHVEICGVRPGRMPPVGALDLAPPWRCSNSPRRREVVGQQPAEHEGPLVSFGERGVAGVVTECGEVGVGHGRRSDRERRQPDLVNRAFPVGFVPVARRCTHPVLAVRHRDEFDRERLRPSSARQPTGRIVRPIVGGGTARAHRPKLVTGRQDCLRARFTSRPRGND